MAKTIEETVDILQKLHEDIQGINWAPRLGEYPRGEISDRGVLPTVLIIPRNGSWTNPFGIGCRSEERDWDIVVIVSDTGQDLETEFFQEIARLIDEFGELYNGTSISTESDGDLLVIVNEEFPSDTGIDDEISHADTRYYGFQFTVRIWRKAA